MKIKERLHHLLEKYILFIERRYVILFIIWIVVIAVGLISVFNIGIENTREVFLNKEDPEVVYYEEISKQFPQRDMLLITLESDDLFALDFYKKLYKISQEIKQIEHVMDVINIYSKYEMIGLKRIEYFRRLYENLGVIGLLQLAQDLNALIEESPESEGRFTSQEQIDKIKEEIITNPYSAGSGLINVERGIISVLVYLDPEFKDSHAGIIDQVKEFINEYFPETPHRLVGEPVLVEYLGEVTAEVGTFYSWVLVFFGIVFLFVSFRRFRGVLFPFFSIIIAEILTLAFLALFWEMNFMFIIIPVLIFILTLMNSIYILQEYTRNMRSGMEQHEAVTQALREKMIVTFLANFTTAVGVLSLLTSDFEIIRNFSIIVAAGIVFSFLSTTMFLPLLLYLIPDKKPHPHGFKKLGGMNKYLHFVSNFNFKFYPIIIAIFIIPAIFAGVYFYTIGLESNVLNYFDEDTEIHSDFKYVEDNLMGLSQIEIIFEFDKDLPRPTLWSYIYKIHQMEKLFLSDEDITQIFSANTLITELYGVITGEFKLPSYFVYNGVTIAVDKQEPEFFDVYLNSSEGLYRILCFTKTLDYIDLQDLVERNEERLSQMNYNFNVEIKHSGAYYLNTMIQKFFIKTFATSFLFSFIFIFITVLIFIRKFWLSLIAMIPCSLPILLTLGIMEIFGLKIDVSTALLAPLGLGIAVDNTIHFLHYYKRSQSGNGLNNKFFQVFDRMNRPMILTSLIMVLGFSIFAVSILIPIRNFGILIAALIAFAFLANSFLLPSLITLFDKIAGLFTKKKDNLA